MNKLYYAVIGAMIMCLLLLSFSELFTNNTSLMNIIFLYTFGTITGGLFCWLFWDYFLEKEIAFYEKKQDALEKRYYEKDQERLAYIHKIQIEKDALNLDYENLKNEVADNLGLSASEADFIRVGGTD